MASVLDLEATDNVALVQRESIAHAIVPMAATWNDDVTCNGDSTALTTVVDKWVAQMSQWKTIEKYMLLSIANEWGPENGTAWRDAYKSAIGRLRTAGYK